MIKRHEAALMDVLEQLDQVGWAEVEWWKIYLWYDAERLTKRIYRDLRDRFLESGDEVDLHMYPGNQSLLLVKGDELTALATKLGEADD